MIRHPAERGQEIKIALEPSKLHFFDNQTEESIHAYDIVKMRNREAGDRRPPVTMIQSTFNDDAYAFPEVTNEILLMSLGRTQINEAFDENARFEWLLHHGFDDR